MNASTKISSKSYYPFGMVIPGRSFSTTAYKWGFNGKEKDDEVSGSGNQYDYGFRIYNPRIAKFLSVDPLTKKFAMLTPYQFASNSPIDGIDLDGLEYLKSDEARIEATRGGVYLKLSNFHWVTQNKIDDMNENPSYWAKNEIGINTQAAGFEFKVQQEDDRKTDAKYSGPYKVDDDPNYRTEASKVKVNNPIAESTGQPDKRFKNREIDAPPSPGYSKGAALFIFAVDIINIGGDYLSGYLIKNDMEKVKHDMQVLNKAMSDVNTAVKIGIIPIKYQNQVDITNILNVVLQGENKTTDKGIYNTGMKIVREISKNCQSDCSSDN